MLDLRNVYRKVSSKIHDFTQAHLDNIHAIVGLYRGDNTLYNKLVANYKATDNTTELEWLTSRFPDGEYVDILGLCKVVNRAEIADNDYSLTPGRYVGVEDQIDYDFDYETEMGIIKKELEELNSEAKVLGDQIQTNLNELGL
jgi:type I restriction enzyme M protein